MLSVRSCVHIVVFSYFFVSVSDVCQLLINCCNNVFSSFLHQGRASVLRMMKEDMELKQQRFAEDRHKRDLNEQRAERDKIHKYVPQACGLSCVNIVTWFNQT